MHDGEEVRLTSVGRLVKEKGFDQLICSCEKLISEGYSLRLTIVGGGDNTNYDEVLKDMIVQKHMQNVVTLTGTQSDPQRFVADSDIYVQASHFESFGITIREAQMLGMPVISTRTAGACTLIQDGIDGLLCNDSVEDIATAIKRLIEDKELKEKLERNCSQTDWNLQNQEQLKIFDAICQ